MTDVATGPKLHDESGEGVISTAIAVLIMALIGAGMWLVFSGVITQAEERIRSAVVEIGA
ncbi:MAG: hypothetical protein WD360_04395 [Nitriliruptoraceae bacterium]